MEETKYFDLLALTGKDGEKRIGYCKNYEASSGMIAFDKDGNQFFVKEVTNYNSEDSVAIIKQYANAVEITGLYKKAWGARKNAD